MRKSAVNPKYQFTESEWVLSILNINTSPGLKKLYGHSTLVLEGLNKDDDSFIFKLFVGQYDIIGSEDFISDVRVFEKNEYFRNYRNFSSYSYYVDPEDVLKMVNSIKDDKKRIDRGEKIPFQLVKLKSNGKSYNCTSWCYEKMRIIDIDPGGKPKPKLAVCNIL